MIPSMINRAAGQHGDSRHGATLVEVLMSILIMSVGIVSVFALFPVAMLSSIRANQLTNAVVLQDNVRELIHTMPQIVEPPIGSPWDTGAVYPWKGQWRAATRYALNDVIIPTLQPGQIFPAPYYALLCIDAPSTNGLSGFAEPEWTINELEYKDGDYTWKVVDIPNYVVDPIGAYALNGIATNHYVFGNRDASTPDTLTVQGVLPRRSYCQQFTMLQARDICSSPDSWTVEFETIPIRVGDIGETEIEVSQEFNINELSRDPSLTRVVLTSPDGRQSYVARLPGPTVTMTDGQILLDTATPIPVGNWSGPLRVETFSRKFTYILAVHSNGRSYPPTLSVGLMFNRNVSLNAEFAYRANFGNASFSNVPELVEPSLQPDQVKIAWASGDPVPLLRVGNYLFDAVDVRFYRITAVTENANSAIVTVHKDVGRRTFDQDGAGLAIFLPGLLFVDTIQ